MGRRCCGVVDRVYWELLGVVGGFGSVFVRDGRLFVESSDVFRLWDLLEDFCGELVVVDAWVEGLIYYVVVKCVSRGVDIVLPVKGLSRPYYLHPAIALYKKEVFLRP